MRSNDKRERRIRRHKRVRAKVRGTLKVPRLSIFRSNRHIWAQLIDDVSGKTIAAASDLEIKSKIKVKDGSAATKIALAEKVGELIAKKALEKKITSVVFDRGGYKYHGIVKAAADGARKGGLKL